MILKHTTTKHLKVTMSNQTVVQWMVEEINKQKAWADPSKLEPIIEQAKQIEKSQIEDAWLNGKKGEMIAPLSIDNYRPEAEEYYNETYTNEK